MSRPIISLSLPKSGTTTLADALREAGLKVADWRIRRHETDTLAIQDQLVAQLMYEDYFDSGDPLARLGEFDAITEMNAVNKNVCLCFCQVWRITVLANTIVLSSYQRTAIREKAPDPSSSVCGLIPRISVSAI